MFSVFVLKVTGLVIIIAVLGVAWALWINASRLEEEINNERRRSGEK